MSLGVVAQLPGGDEDCIKQLVDLQVSCLGLVEDLTDVVHRILNNPDPVGGSGASTSIGASSGSSRSSGSGGTSEVWVPTTVWPWEPEAASGD
jgi:hypothetical protein